MKRTLRVTLVVAGSILVGGCASGPYGGGGAYGGMSNTMKGAGLGALGGAGIGALATKNRGTGALIGAAAGALLGGGIGYYMDRQEQQLRQSLEGTGVEVRREADNLKVIMPSHITFDTNSANILPGFYSSLNSVAQVLRENDQTTVEVTGHTDSRGSNSYNQQLSERRAQSVANYLTSQGVNSARISSRGMGETVPVGDNNTESGRAQNRRVEVVIRPVAQQQGTAPGYQQPPAYNRQPTYNQPPAYNQPRTYNPQGYNPQPTGYNPQGYGNPPQGYYPQGAPAPAYTPPGYQPPQQQPYPYQNYNY